MAIPGGTDILIHARRAFREAVTSDPSMGVWVNVDFTNAFPSLTRPCSALFQASRRGVCGAMLRHRRCGPQLAARSSLTVARSRGTLGSLQCGVALAGVRERGAVARRVLLAGIGAGGFPPAAAGPEPFDVWFAGYGQGHMRPAMLQEYLHTLDDEAAKVGAVRSAGDAAKSTAVLVGHPAALAAFEAEQQQLRQQQLPTWDSPRSAVLVASSNPTHRLRCWAP